MADKAHPVPPPPAQFFNQLRVTSTEREFFIELAQTTDRVGQLVGRFVTTPEHMREIAQVLAEALKKHEGRKSSPEAESK